MASSLDTEVILEVQNDLGNVGAVFPVAISHCQVIRHAEDEEEDGEGRKEGLNCDPSRRISLCERVHADTVQFYSVELRVQRLGRGCVSPTSIAPCGDWT